MIVLSPARTKNKRQHELPLAPQALAILRRAISAAGATDNSNANGTSTVIETKHHSGNGRANDVGVFGVNGFPPGGWSGYKASLDRWVGLAQSWRLHDLRRTAATTMADKLGVLPHIIEAILNHVSGHKSGVAGIYNRAKYR